MDAMHRVVSVEDDLGIFQVIKASLKKLPIELHHAASGNAAIDLIEQQKPHLIILDISLPDMNGWDVLENVSHLDIEKPDVIVLTAFTDPTHRLIGHLHNVTYMSKPFLPKELASTVTDILDIQ